MEILATEKLTKKYKRLTALNQLDFSIQKGMVFGLLGPNGSGKTTTLGMLLNVIQPTSGSYRWFGKSPSPSSRQQIGAILEIPCFLPYLTATQNLKIIAEIKKCSYQAIDKTLETIGLYERRDDPFKTFSLGMKQRLAIGAALLSNPEVLIFDEPTNGLDPKGIVEIRELIIEIAQTGKTIILASHLLDEVQKVCSDFMVLRKGEKLFQGRVEDALLNQKTIEVGSPNLEMLKNTLERFSGIKELTTTADQCILKTNNQVTTTQIGQFLLEQNIPVNHLVKKEGSLEKEFLNILSEHE